MQREWLAEITNDPRRDYDLCIVISESDRHRGTIARTESGELILTIDPLEAPVEIPARWLAEILLGADKDLPGGE